MATLPAAKFKARCLELMDQVRDRRTSILITKRGVPVAKLVPPDPPRKGQLFGCLAGLIEIRGDIVSPAVPPEEWDLLLKKPGKLGGPRRRGRE